MLLVNKSVLHGVKRFVFTSSIAVYGAEQTPTSEDVVPRPEDPYGISKYAVELDLAAAQDMFGLDYTVFRPHNVYGERQNISDPYRNAVGIFMNRLLQGQPMPDLWRRPADSRLLPHRRRRADHRAGAAC